MIGFHNIISGHDVSLASFSNCSLSSRAWGAFGSAKNHQRQRRKRQSVTAKREKSQTPISSYRLGQVRLS